MSNITPITPSFTFGYWRPWKQDANLFDSYLNYTKDVSLANYSANIVKEFINEVSQEQIYAINEVGTKIVTGINLLSDQISDMNSNVNELNRKQEIIINKLSFLNRRMDIQIEQQKITNLLLGNIIQLLRVPDSEKERQQNIEFGLKFFINANKDEDLYNDALEQLLKAEVLMKQDYFVLHRIGLIYMYSKEHLNPQIALDYFTRAAKYAIIESDPNAAILANVLANNVFYDEYSNDINDIKRLAAVSFEKAAFSAYVLGKFELAVENQTKALENLESAENYFLLAKYQTRLKRIDLCTENLNKSIDTNPRMALATFNDLDLVSFKEVLKLIEEKNNEIDKNVRQLIEDWKLIQTKVAQKAISELNQLLISPYDVKVAGLTEHRKIKQKNDDANEKVKQLVNEWEGIQTDLKDKVILDLHELLNEEYQVKFDKIQEFEKLTLNTKREIDYKLKDIIYISNKIRNSLFANLNDNEVEMLLVELNNSKSESLEVMQVTYNRIQKVYLAERIIVGSEYGGGIVFHIDESGKHGLVVAKERFEAIWSLALRNFKKNTNYTFSMNDPILSFENGKKIGTKKEIGEGRSNTQLILKEASSIYFFPIKTAARLCSNLSLNGFKDWHLPSIDELELIYKNLFLRKYRNDEQISRRREGLKKFRIEVYKSYYEDIMYDKTQTNKKPRYLTYDFIDWNGDYWSSSEYDNGLARGITLLSGKKWEEIKNTKLYVRAIRSF